MAGDADVPGSVANFASLLGANEDAVRLLISILLGFPFALIHRYTLYGKNAIAQHLFFTACGLLVGYWNYEYDIIHSAAAVIVTFLVIKICPANFIVIVTFLFNMGYLLTGYYLTSTESYDIKWTMAQCVLTLRLIGLSFDISDSRILKKSQSGANSDLSSDEVWEQFKEKLPEPKRAIILRHTPTFLEMAAFAYFPGSFLVGPQFNIRRYLDYVNGQLFKSAPTESEEMKPPNCLGPGLWRALIGFVYVVMFQLGMLYVSDQYLLEDEYRNVGFAKRLFLLGLWGRINLYKYISCWLITEGVCTTFGITYNGNDKEGNARWDGCANVKLYVFETATEFNHYIMSFNINTNHWCAEYIYKRLKFLGSKLYSQLATLLFLAIWHGFHSGYYVCFLMEFLVMYLEKDLKPVLLKCERLQHLYNTSQLFRASVWIVLKIYTFVFMGYCLIGFVHLSYSRYMIIFRSIYFCGHVFFISYMIFAPLIKKAILSTNRAHKD